MPHRILVGMDKRVIDPQKIDDMVANSQSSSTFLLRARLFEFTLTPDIAAVPHRHLFSRAAISVTDDGNGEELTLF